MDRVYLDSFSLIQSRAERHSLHYSLFRYLPSSLAIYTLPPRPCPPLHPLPWVRHEQQRHVPNVDRQRVATDELDPRRARNGAALVWEEEADARTDGDVWEDPY